MNEPHDGTYVVRADELKRLMRENGFSLESLAKKAIVSVKTLRRILQGARALISTIKKIADALAVPCSHLLSDYAGHTESESAAETSASKGFKGSIGIGVPFEQFDETSTLFDILRAINLKIGQQGQIIIIAITPSQSVGIQFVLTDTTDFHALVRAFAAQSLQDLAITSLDVDPRIDVIHDVADGFASTNPTASFDRAERIESTLRAPRGFPLWMWLRALPFFSPAPPFHLFVLDYQPEGLLIVQRQLGTIRIRRLRAVIPAAQLEAAQANLIHAADDN